MQHKRTMAVSAGALCLALASGVTQAHAAPVHAHAQKKCGTEQGEVPSYASDAVPPFLKLPFRKQDGKGSLTVTNGWKMSEDEVPIAGNGLHASLDFEFTKSRGHGYGLPILAAADGVAYYSYQYVSEIIDGHQYGVGAGLVIEIRHANGYVSQYIHPSAIAKKIPYVGATADPDVAGDWIPTGIFASNADMNAKGVPVKQGDVIGWQGDTGMGKDWKDNFNGATGKVTPRNRHLLKPWDPPQLHFNLYKGRYDAGGYWAKDKTRDALGLYLGVTNAQNPYSPKPGVICASKQYTSFKLDKKGHPKYAG